MNTKRFLLIFCTIALLILLVASCAQPTTEIKEVVKTVIITEIVEGEVKTVIETQIVEVIITPKPAAEATEEPAEPGLEPTRIPYTQPLPTATAPVLPTSPLPVLPSPIAPTPIIEQRFVEVEWPPIMRLGESDVVRLALIPSQDGYTAAVEYSDHQVITQTVSVPRPGGYDLFAAARLDGVGFVIAPTGDQVQFLPLGEDIFWRWSLSPRDSGKQRLLISLALRWIPTSATSGPAREVIAHSQGLDVQVVSFLGLSQVQALFAGLMGLVFGSGLSIFALVFVKPKTFRHALKIQSPNPDLAIELSSGVNLARQEHTVLQTLFQRYKRLVVKEEFLSGYSGARTFLALPIRADGRSDAYTIAKLGERTAILAEFENYETFVKDTLPPITARIQHPPITTSLPSRGLRPAALQYTFIGEPGSSPTSLRQALLNDPNPDLLYKLFDTFGPNWWMQRHPYTFRLGQEYDRMLPTHVVLEPAPGKGRPLDGRQPPAELHFQIGDLVTLSGLPTIEMRADGRSLSLLGSGSPGHPALRVRWLSLDRSDGATGRVVATRHTLLQEYTADCDLLGLPDPFPRIPELLAETVSGGQSIIHGDLNLENVLVGPGELVWLIDFAQTREGHTLYDFAHLEAELIAHVFAPQIKDPKDYLSLVDDPEGSPYTALYALRNAVHKIAERCLFNPTQPREYNLALVLACLGALKFANLDMHSKHLLLLTAAYIAREL